MDKNQLPFVKNYENFEPFSHKRDAIIDNCCREYQKKYYHTFEYECEYDNKPTSFRNNEIVNLTIVD